MAQLDLLLREKDWRRWADDPRTFIEECVVIRHPEHGIMPFRLRPAQVQFLESIHNERHTLVLKSRQIGYSSVVAAYCLWMSLFQNDRYIIMLSIGEREAGKLLAKVILAYNRLPTWMQERVLRTDRGAAVFTLQNGSQIESLPSSHPARGEAASLIVVDEWAFFENPEDAWSSIEPAYQIGGRLVALSTANGWGNFFHEMWLRATTGRSRFKPMFQPYSAVPERDEEWWNAELEEHAGQEWIVYQEYPRNPDEAFIKSGDTVFDVDYLSSLPTTPPFSRGELNHAERLKSYGYRESPKGALRVWAFPQEGHHYGIGADVAEGLEHGDASCAHVIDVTTGVVVAVYHARRDTTTFGEDLCKLGWWYNDALIGPEANGPGLAVIKTIQHNGYRRLYRSRQMASVREKGSRQERYGWLTRSNTKFLMIEELRRSLHDKTTIVYDEETMVELKTYVRDGKGGMNGSPFDDRVVSLAIANQMRKWVFAREYEKPKEDTEWTWEWWRDKIETEKEAQEVQGWHLGQRAWANTGQSSLL